MNLPGFRLHSLKGRLRGYWAVAVRSNWRFEGNDAVDATPIACRARQRSRMASWAPSENAIVIGVDEKALDPSAGAGPGLSQVSHWPRLRSPRGSFIIRCTNLLLFPEKL
jgi:hypothetical protein